LHLLALKPLVVCEGIVEPDTFELEASDCVGVVVGVCKGRSVNLKLSEI
jgi:hypothetical protein